MTRVGRYEVLRELGRGGMGVVYEVRDPDAPGRRLALKLLRSGAAGEEALRRFEREVELLARVRHGNVVAIHTTSWAREGPYLVMDLVDGRPLQGVKLPAREAARVVRALCDAVAAIHAQGVLHRDLKPANALLRPDGSPVLLDFGLARELTGERLTRTGQVLGSPRYLAPESITDRAAVDARTDVYGLGAVLFELLGGEAPYADVGGSAVLVMQAVVSRAPRWPTGAPAALLGVLQRAMARGPAGRHPSVAALAADLDAYLGGERRAPLRRARLALVSVVAALGLGLAASVTVSVTRRRAARAGARRAVAEVAAWDERTLAPWGLGLGAGDSPAPGSVARATERVASALGLLPVAERERAEQRLARLEACARRLTPGARAARPGPTTALVAALEAERLDEGLRHLLEAPASTPEWPLVRAELELGALRAGPVEAARVLPLLPRGTLVGADAAAFARRKGAALRDPETARRWALAFEGWLDLGARPLADADAHLAHLVAATARAAPADEVALLQGLREVLGRRVASGGDEVVARAMSLDAWLRSLLGGEPPAELHALAGERIEVYRHTNEVAPSAALTYVALATGNPFAGSFVRQLGAGTIEPYVLDPARSRAVRYVALVGPATRTDVVALARAGACLDAPVDDLAEVLVLQAHERLLSAVGELRHVTIDAASVTRARASIAALRASLRREGAALERMGGVLRAELVARCAIEGWARAPQVVADIEAFLEEAPGDRPDWPTMRPVVDRYLSLCITLEAEVRAEREPPELVRALADLALALARRALASEVLLPYDAGEARAIVIRCHLLAGRPREAEAFARAHLDPGAWAHHWLPLEVARALRASDPAAAAAVLRAALERPHLTRGDRRWELERALQHLEGR